MYLLWKTFIKRPSNIFTVKKCSPSIGENKLYLFSFENCWGKNVRKVDSKNSKKKQNLKPYQSAAKRLDKESGQWQHPLPLDLPIALIFAALSMHFILTLFHPSSAIGWTHLVGILNQILVLRTGGNIFPVQCRPRTRMKWRTYNLCPLPRLQLRLAHNSTASRND